MDTPHAIVTRYKKFESTFHSVRKKLCDSILKPRGNYIYYGPPRTYQWNGDTTQTNIECIWMMSVTYNRDSTTRLFYLHELSFKLINNYKNIQCLTEHHQYIRHHIICSKPENLLQLCQLLLSYFNKNPEATSSFKELLLSLRLPVSCTDELQSSREAEWSHPWTQRPRTTSDDPGLQGHHCVTSLLYMTQPNEY